MTVINITVMQTMNNGGLLALHISFLVVFFYSIVTFCRFCFVVECGAKVTRLSQTVALHQCKRKMKRFPWGRAVLITKFEVDSS